MNYVYVPDVIGGYKKADFNAANMSFNMICDKLGYLNLYYIWFTKDYKTNVCFKIFSKDIICIVLDDDLGAHISENYVKNILVTNNYNYDDAFSVYDRENSLKEGIEGGYLTEKFMIEATKSAVINSKIADVVNGYTYYFENGIMVNYSSNDGLIGYAKEMKDTAIFNIVKRNAEKYYLNKEEVIDEINRQFNYYTLIPGNYLNQASNYNYNYNFGLLYVDTVMPDITLAEFNKITHFAAKKKRENASYLEMEYNSKRYCFDEQRKLTIHSYQEPLGSIQSIPSSVSNKIVIIGNKEKVVDKIYDINGSIKSICIELPMAENINSITALVLNKADMLLNPNTRAISFLLKRVENRVQALDVNTSDVFFSTDSLSLLNQFSSGGSYLGQMCEFQINKEEKNIIIDIIFTQF